MGTTTITYPAKCKDCHFHASAYEGKRKVTKCMYGCEKIKEVQESTSITWVYWSNDQKQTAPKITLRSTACYNFVLWGHTEERVKEIINQRG